MPTIFCRSRMILACAYAIAMMFGAATQSQAKNVDLGQTSAQGPITFPKPEIVDEIWIEIGEVDVTAFASVDQDTILLSGFAPLSSGAHVVTVYAPDGDKAVVIASFTVTVVANTAFSHNGLLTVAAQSDDTAETLAADIAGEVAVQSGSGFLAAQALSLIHI